MCYYTESGREWLNENWKLCWPLVDDDDVRTLKSWASEVYVALSMVNYPYKANFLAPLPANPVKVIRPSMKKKKKPPILLIIITCRLADYVCMIRLQELCKSMTNHSEDAETLLKSVFAGLSVYFNYTGTADCLDVSSVYPIGMNGWNYQVGKQRYLVDGKSSVDDMRVYNPFAYNIFRNYSVATNILIYVTINAKSLFLGRPKPIFIIYLTSRPKI